MLPALTYETVAGFTQSLSLVIFFTIFIGVVVYAVWPGNRKTFEKASRMPLDSDEQQFPISKDTGGRS